MVTNTSEVGDISFSHDRPSSADPHVALPTHDAQRTAHDALPTVLVVDDESLIRTSWKASKRSLNIGELFAYPNLEALQEAKLDLSKIDLAFVDKNIEDSKYSGSDVVKYLKEQRVKKIIVASGEAEELIRQDRELARADHIISEKIPDSLEEFLKPLISESAVIIPKENSASLQSGTNGNGAAAINEKSLEAENWPSSSETASNSPIKTKTTSLAVTPIKTKDEIKKFCSQFFHDAQKPAIYAHLMLQDYRKELLRASAENLSENFDESKTLFKQYQPELTRIIEKNRKTIATSREEFSLIPELSQTFDHFAKQLSDIENSLTHFSDLARNRSRLDDQLATIESMKDQNEAHARRVFEKII